MDTNDRRKMTVGEVAILMFAIVIPIIIAFVYKIRDTKCEYYRKGLAMGSEMAEEHCYQFDEDYGGSLEWIKKHNPKVYDEIIDEQNNEYGLSGCAGIEQSFFEKLLDIY